MLDDGEHVRLVLICIRRTMQFGTFFPGREHGVVAGGHSVEAQRQGSVQHSPKLDVLVAPHAWIFPFVANRMGIKSTVVCVTQDEGQFIDTEALKLVKEFFVAMGFSYDHEKAKNTIATVRNMESQINEQRWFTDDDEDGAWMV